MAKSVMFDDEAHVMRDDTKGRAIMEGGPGNRDVRNVRQQVISLLDQLQGLADAEARLAERGKGAEAPELGELLAQLERAA
jgi:hypothetical protein